MTPGSNVHLYKIIPRGFRRHCCIVLSDTPCNSDITGSRYTQGFVLHVSGRYTYWFLTILSGMVPWNNDFASTSSHFIDQFIFTSGLYFFQTRSLHGAILWILWYNGEVIGYWAWMKGREGDTIWSCWTYASTMTLNQEWNCICGEIVDIYPFRKLTSIIIKSNVGFEPTNDLKLPNDSEWERNNLINQRLLLWFEGAMG